MFSFKTDSCQMNYCQDGVMVYGDWLVKVHFVMQPIKVNDRSYLVGYSYHYTAELGIWWSEGFWFIGPVSIKGQPNGYMRYKTDEYCPHQLTQHGKWNEKSEQGWISTNDVVISCKYMM